MENILVDMPWKGQPRKLLLHPGRTGFMFVLDRETGEVLSAENFEPVTWASGYDLKTGLPIENPDKRPHTAIITRVASAHLPLVAKNLYPRRFPRRLVISTSLPTTLAWIIPAKK